MDGAHASHKVQFDFKTTMISAPVPCKKLTQVSSGRYQCLIVSSIFLLNQDDYQGCLLCTKLTLIRPWAMTTSRSKFYSNSTLHLTRMIFLADSCAKLKLIWWSTMAMSHCKFNFTLNQEYGSRNVLYEASTELKTGNLNVSMLL